MGKKAVFYLFDILMLALAAVLALFSMLASLTGVIAPCRWWFPSLLGLGLTPLLAANLIMLLFWAYRKKYLRIIIPTVALLANIGYIRATVGFSFGKEKTESPLLKVASYNAHRFNRSDFKTIVGGISRKAEQHQIDVVCFQEFTVSHKYNMDSIQASLQSYPYAYVPETEDGSVIGVAIFSRFPITNTGHVVYPDSDNKITMWVDADVHGKTIRIFNSHLQTTSINYSKKEIRELKRMMEGQFSQEQEAALSLLSNRMSDNACKRAAQAEYIHRLAQESPHPVIVCGDFNDTPGSYTYKKISANLKDAFTEKGKGYGYTFREILKLLRIDYILYSPEFKALSYESPQEEWSDHNPVVVSLGLR